MAYILNQTENLDQQSETKNQIEVADLLIESKRLADSDLEDDTVPQEIKGIKESIQKRKQLHLSYNNKRLIDKDLFDQIKQRQLQIENEKIALAQRNSNLEQRNNELSQRIINLESRFANENSVNAEESRGISRSRGISELLENNSPRERSMPQADNTPRNAQVIPEVMENTQRRTPVMDNSARGTIDTVQTNTVQTNNDGQSSNIGQSNNAVQSNAIGQSTNHYYEVVND